MKRTQIELRRAVAACALAGGVLLIAAACGSEAGDAAPTDPNAGSSGLLGLTCNPTCAAGNKCSVSGVCIPSNGCAVDGDCPNGTVCDTQTNECIPGGGCGAEEATGASTPPNVLIVLDRSCSMKEKVAAVTKWAIAVEAVNTLVNQNIGKIRFGLELFPDIVEPRCEQGPFAKAVGPGDEAAITGLLTKALDTKDPFWPDGPCVTNIDTAMQAAAADPAWGDTSRGNFVVLITDGRQENCNVAEGDTGTTRIITELYQQKKVPTFVVGFGKGIDPKQMNLFAEAGGTPRNDPTTKYYQADDQASLQTALNTIAKKTLSCVFTLSKTPPNPAQIYAFFDNKTTVPRDPGKANGFEYDAATNNVTFYGQACEDLKLAKVTDVDIVLGCPEPTAK